MSRSLTIILISFVAIMIIGATIMGAIFVGSRLIFVADQNGPVTPIIGIYTPEVSTATPTITATNVTVTPTTTPTVTPTSAVPAAATASQSNVCTDAATFIADVTVPDGMQIAPGTGFVKTWRIKNSGTCTWDGRYKLVFAGGNTLGSLANSFALPATVAPGELVDLSVSLVAPTTPASYQGDWKLQNPQSQNFGIGANRNGAFWVKITVSATPVSPNSSITGFVWQDKDHDNAVDSNEMLANITVTLATGAECRNILASTKSDSNGRYSFSKLAANSYCLFGTDGSTTVSQSNIVLGNNQQLTEVKVTWPPVWAPQTVISGLVYQDANQNGTYDSGEQLMGNQPVYLFPGTACQVKQDAIAVSFTLADGRFTLAGEFSGNYCVGLAGPNGLDDVMSITVSSGQTLNNINLKSPVPNGSISGYLWNDYCMILDNGNVLDGNCVPDGNGSYHADGMIQPTETNIAGVTILLQVGGCANNTAYQFAAKTDSSGKYTFGNLGPGTYCVSMNAASNENASLLLPGDWTFPAKGIWYQEITLQQGANAYSVNFGWDYQLK